MALPCEDCGSDDDFERRTSCPQCGLKICFYCRAQFHKPAIEAKVLCRTQRSAMVSAPEQRYGIAR